MANPSPLIFLLIAYFSSEVSTEASPEASPHADKVTKDTAAANMIIEKIFFILIYFNWFLTRQKYNIFLIKQVDRILLKTKKKNFIC